MGIFRRLVRRRSDNSSHQNDSYKNSSTVLESTPEQGSSHQRWNMNKQDMSGQDGSRRFPQQRKETDSISMSSLGLPDDDDDDQNKSGPIRVRRLRDSDNSSTWDEYENKKQNDARRSLSAASLLRILIQQQHDERKRRRMQEMKDQPTKEHPEFNNSEHEIKFEDGHDENRHVDDDDDDDDIPIFLRQKKTVLGHGILLSESLLHPINYTQNNHVLVNYEREKRRLLPYHRNVHMDRLARLHADRMAKEGTLFHSVQSVDKLQSMLYPLPVTAQRKVANSDENNISSLQFQVAENISRGESVRAIHNESMMHTNHMDRKNILSKHFTEFGMGTAVVYHDNNDDEATSLPKKTIYLVQLFRSTPIP